MPKISYPEIPFISGYTGSGWGGVNFHRQWVRVQDGETGQLTQIYYFILLLKVFVSMSESLAINRSLGVPPEFSDWFSSASSNITISFTMYYKI